MRGRGLAVAECPAPLHLLIYEYVAIAWTVHTVEEHTEAAMGHVKLVPQLEHMCTLLERGSGIEGEVQTEERGGLHCCMCKLVSSPSSLKASTNTFCIDLTTASTFVIPHKFTSKAVVD
jgi:hypothetical protein